MAAALTSGAACAAEEAPHPAFSYTAVYTADLTGVRGGETGPAGRYLDNFDLTGDGDLEQLVGWRGATLQGYLLNNSGGAPNDLAGTLQGVDNIEVARPRLRLFELWIDQSLAGGKASVRAGLYNLNSEFYANDAAALLLAPAFGIGSELAATGPNGPSIFPSTALGVRVNLDLGHGAYARGAVINAQSGVVGDPKGVDLSFDDGVLLIAEGGMIGESGRLTVGGWTYSHRQDDIRDVGAAGDPARRRAAGAYLLAERHLFGSEDGRSANAFARLGVSDGDTTPFAGGWQAGIKLNQPFAGRPESALSIGLEQGVLGGKFRANLRDGGAPPGRAESGVEITYFDRLTRRITVQPDLQWIRHAGGDRDAADRWVAGIRVRIDLGHVDAK